MQEITDIANLKGAVLYGIPICRFKELLDLFAEEGYYLIEDEDFEAIKAKHFGKAKEFKESD